MYVLLVMDFMRRPESPANLADERPRRFRAKCQFAARNRLLFVLTPWCKSSCIPLVLSLKSTLTNGIRSAVILFWLPFTDK